MVTRHLAGVGLVLFISVWRADAAENSDPIVVVAYNVRNWLATEGDLPDADQVEQARPKSEEEKQAAVAILAALQPDVLGITEIGKPAELADLASRLKSAGIDLPHHEWVPGSDDHRHVALLSRFPFVSRDSRSDIRFELDGRPVPISRGILDVTIEPAPGYRLRLIGVHLKSKRPVPEFDQAALRAREASSLRQYVNAILTESPDANLLLWGDFNDTRNEYPVREILGQGAGGVRLTDLRLEDPRGDRWTQYWRTADVYSRFDYLVASPGLLPEILPERSGIDHSPEWFEASDHRAIFTAILPVDQ